MDKLTHIEKLRNRFTFDEFKIITQNCGGRTFEDELFLANCKNIHTATALLKMALPESLQTTIESCKLDTTKWEEQLSSIDGRSKHIIENYINCFNSSVKKKKSKYYKNVTKIFHFRNNRIVTKEPHGIYRELFPFFALFCPVCRFVPQRKRNPKVLSSLRVPFVFSFRFNPNFLTNSRSCVRRSFGPISASTVP